mmetsp:Transcript_2461/g.3979  ORF Transcript_2461/g.3979 Transcript_2461/m.3979 type:complete len:214 (+) Transcript_2461:168-809(+)
MAATSAVPRSPRTRSRRRQRTPTRHTSAAPDESEILTPAHHVHQDQHGDQQGDQQGDQPGEQTLLVTPPALLPPEPEPEPALADQVQNLQEQVQRLQERLQTRERPSTGGKKTKELNPAQGMYSRVGSVLEHHQGKQPLAQYYAQHSARVQAIPDCGCPPHFRCCARQFIAQTEKLVQLPPTWSKNSSSDRSYRRARAPARTEHPMISMVLSM